MKITFIFKPFKAASGGLLALMAVSAYAQIGGSGWTPQTLDFKVQWPYNVAESSRYTFTNGVYHMLTYSTDVAFAQGNTTLPRTEQRFNPDYTSGEIQYQAMLMAPANENSYCVFQIHTGDAQSPTFGSTTFMLFWFSSDGGSVHDYSGTELAKNLGGQWFQLNVDHNLVTRTIKVWVNNALVWTQQDNGATDFYMKDGVYEQNHSPTLQMDTYVKDIQIWTSSGQVVTSSVANPVFSPGAGAYTAAQNVSITSATDGATIRYTTDGSTPSETNGTIYSGSPVGVITTTTLQAIAYEAGFTDSNVTSATYTINLPPPAAAPAFSPGAGTYTAAQNVSITSATGGATIRYTTDGSLPTETHGAIYASAVTFDATTTIKAIAYESGFTDSAVSIGAYNINLPPVATLAFSPGAGTYTTAQNVSITSATSGASIRYTTNGSLPTETNGTLYSGLVNINTTTTLAAIAYKSGLADSVVTIAGFTINLPLPPAATPAFSPAAGTYASAQTVTINSTTGGATIRYTTDDSTPTETNGTLYTGPVSISSTTLLKAIAFKTGFTDSLVPSGIYTITSSPAAILNVICNLTSSNNGGINPYAGLVQGSDGNFYATGSGGSDNDGTVFKITPAGVLTALASFNGTNGEFPYAGLVQGSDGNFYGTTVEGGSDNDGTVFKITPTGVLTTLVSFDGTDGANPQAALIQGSDGSFYGTTGSGGSGNDGTVFKITPAGVLTTLASFDGTDGANPQAALIQGSDGNFYGTTGSEGNGNDGTVFKITPAGVLSTLVLFNGANGDGPSAGLVQGNDGNFYGTSAGGDNDNDGTVFKITAAGVLTTLVSFDGTDGANPQSILVQGSDGNFYGTTMDGGSGNDGTAFQITPGGILTTLVSFDGANGDDPYAGLVQGSDGNFYGTTMDGGISNDGVVFQLILPQTAAPVFSPAAGAYTSAQTVAITSATNGATIRYTTDGSTPNGTTGMLYSGPVSISANTTFNAIAYEAGFTNSAVTSGSYTINATPAPASTPAPPSSGGGGGGGGGGGAPSYWFLGFLAFAGILRWRLRRTEAQHRRAPGLS